MCKWETGFSQDDRKTEFSVEIFFQNCGNSRADELTFKKGRIWRLQTMQYSLFLSFFTYDDATDPFLFGGGCCIHHSVCRTLLCKHQETFRRKRKSRRWSLFLFEEYSGLFLTGKKPSKMCVVPYPKIAEQRRMPQFQKKIKGIFPTSNSNKTNFIDGPLLHIFA